MVVATRVDVIDIIDCFGTSFRPGAGSSRHASARRESPCGPRTWAGWIPAQDRNDGGKVTDASKRSSLSHPPTQLPHILPGLHPGPSIPASSLPICTF
ncbi:hypothetical protein BTN45_20790 [Rhizobium sp. ZX09]|nr:hypothetical protein BTN45_20790 [Rhizobium sp. ZX09]